MKIVERSQNFTSEKPLLYLVATPIGNVSDLSSRALSIFNDSDIIAAEDTRNTGLLLKRLGIEKPMISCHEHNEEEAGEKIVSLLLEGKKVAYASDAGYPGISDPGERLVKKAIEKGINVSVIPGPCAFLTALAASGLDSSHFYFHGFLSSKPSERDKELSLLKGKPETLAFYESPHRIGKTLIALRDYLGKERKACLARELTKTHEEYIRGTLEDLASLDEATLIGEMAIIIEGAKKVAPIINDETLLEALKEELKVKKSKEAVVSVALKYSLKKNEVYEFYLQHFKK